MNSIIETLNQFGGQFLQFAWPMLWQSSLLIGFVLALDFLLARKIRASVRCALWLAVLVKLLLPPTLALPTGAAWWLFHAPPVVKAPAIRNYTVTYDTTPQADYVPPTVALPPPPPPQLNGAGWALLATGAISVGLLLWLALRWWQVARMVRGATDSKGLADLMEEVRRQAGLRSRLRLKLIEGRMSPAVCGLFRPVILLPRILAEQLSPAQLRAVLLHEAFHLRRKDVWVNCAQALLQIIYWWHPLLWIANARIRRIREEAVDDAVMLALRDEADSYAPTLLEVAKLAFRRPLMSLGLVGIMESRSALRQRIERLVDFHAPRKAGLTLVSLCGICVFSAVALPMGEGPAPAEKQSTSDTIKAELQPERAMTFKLNHPEGEDVLKGQLLEAGVKIPPTIIHDFNNGRFFARGTTEQLVLIQQTVLKLNGYSPQEAASDTNIPDYAIKIPVDEPATPQFYSRTFGVSKDAVYANLLEQTGTQSNALDSAAVSAAFRELFTELGLNLKSPPGKAIFYNEKLGKLFANTTASDLDVIECALGALIQPSAQNASGYSSPVDATNVVGITGVLSDSNFNAVIHALKQRTGIESLSEPEVTTTSGRGINKITIPTISAPVSKADAGQLVQDGKLLYEMGKLDEAKAKLKAALALEPDNAAVLYYSNLVAQTESHRSSLNMTGQDRKSTINKLDHIRLDTVSFDSLPLREVLRNLSEQSKLRDPAHEGINFVINPNPDKPGQAIDPATGLPVSPTPTDNSEPVDVGSFIVNIRSLTDVRLADVLAAIVITCDHPIKYSIQDFVVVFSAKGPETPQLFSRTFRVGPNTFYRNLKNFSNQSLNSVPTNGNPYAIDIGDGFTGGVRYITHVNPASDVSVAARKFFTELGVDLESLKGKSVFYNDRLGKLFVKATESDLDTIGRALSALDQAGPQIHIKARFLEVPKGTLQGFKTRFVTIHQPGQTNQSAGLTGILTGENFKTVWKNLENQPGVKALAEPEVETTSGRQTQMRATQTVTILTNSVFEEFPTNHDGIVGSIIAKTGPIETGPVFDVVPYVLSDGYTLYLQMTASSLEFYGYADIPTNLPPLTVTTSTGETVNPPRIWPAVLRYQKSAHVNLFDNQTVILSLTNPEQVRFGEPDEKREAAVAKLIRDTVSHNGGRNDILVFVTATIVDPAGNRVHSDDDLPFAKDKIPPQSSQ